MTETAPRTWSVDDFPLLRGRALRRASLVFTTHGQLSPARDNAILFPTWFGSDHEANRWIIGAGRALDPDHHFIVCVNLLGNGLSSSPSNTPPPHDRMRFPLVTVLDNVRLQRRMLAEVFGIERLQAVAGRSMGAQTALQWGASFPRKAGRVFALCGSARTTPHNYAFLDSLKAALTADCAWNGGDYDAPPVTGLRAVGRAYAAWALSPAFYREGLHLQGGVKDIETFIQQKWAPNFAKRDANDLLAMMATWQNADIASDPQFAGDLDAALAAIRCPAILMPCRTDQYFPPEDNAIAVRGMPNAELRVLESVWGHRAGSANSDARDVAFVEAGIRDLLQRPLAD